MGSEAVLGQKPLYFNWSSGKDSALALHHLLIDKQYQVNILHTTISKELQRVSMHGLSKELLIAQAESIGIPLELTEIPADTSHATYNRIMDRKTTDFYEGGFRDTAFGDIFLEDLRHYREQQLADKGIKAHFPLWKRNTKDLLKEFLALGFRSVIVAANAKWFTDEFVGSVIDEEFINSLPLEVDPCGENGEFHTFCFNGPIFEKSIPYEIGEKVLRSYPDPSNVDRKVEFWFCDLMLKKATI